MKNKWSPSEQVPGPVGQEPAQQQFKDDCDINSIMRRFQKTGAIDHVASYQPQYGMASPVDLHQAMNIVTRAERMFADLPSSLRRKFNGDPRELYEFVQNPDNEVEAKELGLALSTEAQSVADLRKAATPPAPVDPAPTPQGGTGGVVGGQEPAQTPPG